jgi:hypothetical protein
MVTSLKSYQSALAAVLVLGLLLWDFVDAYRTLQNAVDDALVYVELLAGLRLLWAGWL